MRRLLIGALAWTLLAAAPAPRRAPVQQTPAEGYQTATFAGGCFWCMEPPFDELPGVISTTSGYTGGRTRNPTYEDVSAGRTGHAEAVEVVYDPARISYEQLLDVFWKNIDPITPNRQFCDVGTQYRSAIFYHGDEQRRLAEESKRAIESSSRFDKPIVTEVRPAGPFYTAEEYHQDYYKKNPIRFNFYKFSCGRARRLAELWGDNWCGPSGPLSGGPEGLRYGWATISSSARRAARVMTTAAATIAASPRTNNACWRPTVRAEANGRVGLY